MDSVIIAATITGSFSLVLAVYNFLISQRQHSRLESLEQTRAQLTRESDRIRARLDYEYEARKRLYATFEPAMFQLIESAQFALERISRLSDPDMWEKLAAPGEPDPPEFARRPPMAAPKYEFIAMLYAFYSPLVLVRIMRRELTFFDLSLDSRIEVQHYLAAKLYATFTDDTEFSALNSSLPYTPFESGWRQKRLSDPARFWWQGLTMGRLEVMLDRMTVRSEDGQIRSMSFGEFEKFYETTFEEGEERDKKTLAAASNALYRFRPADRPVFCRMLATQACIYRALLQTRADSAGIEIGSSHNLLLRRTLDGDPIAHPFYFEGTYLGVEWEIVEPYLKRNVYTEI